MEANSGSDETLITAKIQINEAFNAGKEIEAMKRLMLHRFYCPALLITIEYIQCTQTFLNCVDLTMRVRV
jgi:hypothetical protein